jgi:hypothetical protein
MRDSVAADSTFYSCCACDIKRKDILFRFLSAYPFFLGDKILGELPERLTNDGNFTRSVTTYNFDYYQLIKPFFGRNPRHINDGEYEAIGIGYMLDAQGKLRFLILDDRRPNKFAKKHFRNLAPRVKGTIGFVQVVCCEDQKITPSQALEFLLKIEKVLTSGEKQRPCSIDPEILRTILMPAIEYIRNYHVSA